MGAERCRGSEGESVQKPRSGRGGSAARALSPGCPLATSRGAGPRARRPLVPDREKLRVGIMVQATGFRPGMRRHQEERLPDRMRTGHKDYLPTLDGWRAIAILAVLIAHGTDTVISPCGLHANDRLISFLKHGVGVEIFFAISGFLICTRLLQERQR